MASFDRERWRAVSPYLDRAMEMAPEELASWLGALRAGQPELAADVEGLLADRDAISRGRFLEDASVLVPTFAREEAPDPAKQGAPTGPPGPRDRPGFPMENAGPYRLIRRLGEGGMG